MSLQRTWPFAMMGVILSSYALYVEHKMAHKPDEEEFVALCDIDAIGASCSAVFQLPEGRMLSYFGIVPEGHIFDIPNAALGILYYSFWLLLMPMLPKQLTFLASTAAMSSSLFLATRLVILKELCILCWSTHTINARLWWSAFSKFVAKDPTQDTGTSSSPLKAKVY